MNDNFKYTERDIKLAEDLGGIKTLQQTILDKLDSYCAENAKHHSAMWKKIDSHGKAIHKIYGGIAVVGALVGGIWFWMKNKFGY